jgi:hypothetical protein
LFIFAASQGLVLSNLSRVRACRCSQTVTSFEHHMILYVVATKGNKMYRSTYRQHWYRRRWVIWPMGHLFKVHVLCHYVNLYNIRMHLFWIRYCPNTVESLEFVVNQFLARRNDCPESYCHDVGVTPQGKNFNLGYIFLTMGDRMLIFHL